MDSPSFWMRFFLATVALCGVFTAASGDAGESRRLFDFTPASADNPVVVRIDDTLEIPLSELRAYRDAERLQAVTDPASLPQKRAVAEDLITEYLQVDEACRTGVDRLPGFVRQMEATRTLVLTDFISTRLEHANLAAAAGPGDATRELADRLFEAADVRISNEAYAVLKAAARALDQVRTEVRPGPVLPPPGETQARLYAILERTPQAVLARCEDQAVSVHQVLSVYAGLSDPRPDLTTTDGLLDMLKPLIVPELLAREAVRQGVADDPEFQHKFAQNRNALLRFHMHALVDREVNVLMRAPDSEARLRAWHAEHRARYGPPDNTPGASRPTYEEVRAVVEGDYSVMMREKLFAEKARQLRQSRRIQVDEAVLARL